MKVITFFFNYVYNKHNIQEQNYKEKSGTFHQLIKNENWKIHYYNYLKKK